MTASTQLERCLRVDELMIYGVQRLELARITHGLTHIGMLLGCLRSSCDDGLVVIGLVIRWLSR
jgi:hypothetical protein